MVGIPSVAQMFSQFIIILLLGTLSNGFRTLHATIGKSIHSGVTKSLFFVIGLRICAFYLPEKWVASENIVYLEMGCTMTISVAFLGFAFRLLDQEDLLEEYITYLQDIYFQIIN